MAFSFRPDPQYADRVEHPAIGGNHQRSTDELENIVWTNLLGRGSFGDSQTHAQDGIGSEVVLVLGSIELDKELVDLSLVLDIKVLLDELRTNRVVDVLNGFQDTLSTPL